MTGADTKMVVPEAEKESTLRYLYDSTDTIEEKINKIACKCYGADGVVFSDTARKKLAALDSVYTQFSVCVAKTQYSFSDDPKKLNVPENFNIFVRDIEIKSG